MIVHRCFDGSEGYEYELGDEVRILGVIPSGEWFSRVVGRIGKVVELEGLRRARKPRNWRIDPLYVRDTPDWGPSYCMPWQVKPTILTLIKAPVVHQSDNKVWLGEDVDRDALEAFIVDALEKINGDISAGEDIAKIYSDDNKLPYSFVAKELSQALEYRLSGGMAP